MVIYCRSAFAQKLPTREPRASLLRRLPFPPEVARRTDGIQTDHPPEQLATTDLIGRATLDVALGCRDQPNRYGSERRDAKLPSSGVFVEMLLWPRHAHTLRIRRRSLRPECRRPRPRNLEGKPGPRAQPHSSRGADLRKIAAPPYPRSQWWPHVATETWGHSAIGRAAAFLCRVCVATHARSATVRDSTSMPARCRLSTPFRRNGPYPLAASVYPRTARCDPNIWPKTRNAHHPSATAPSPASVQSRRLISRRPPGPLRRSSAPAPRR